MLIYSWSGSKQFIVVEDTERREELKRIRYTMVFVVLAVAALTAFAVNIAVGSTEVPIPHILRFLTGGEIDSKEQAIIVGIRMPRVLMAAILGGGLSVSGFLLQTFFGNPIAGPFVLGISSGAKLTVALAMVWFLERFKAVSSWTLVLAAFVGALIATGFILLVSKRVRSMSALLVAGIMIGYICSAVTDFAVTFAEHQDFVNHHGWSQGRYQPSTWESTAVSAVIVGVAVMAAFLLSKPIGAYQLKKNYARSLGVNVRVFRVVLILLSSVLSACVTAFAGPISFVGMAVPHLVKQSLGTAKPVVVIPGVFLGGAVFCMVCDLIARTAFAPLSLIISTVTSVFGAPVVIFILLNRQKEKI